MKQNYLRHHNNELDEAFHDYVDMIDEDRYLVDGCLLHVVYCRENDEWEHDHGHEVSKEQFVHKNIIVAVATRVSINKHTVVKPTKELPVGLKYTQDHNIHASSRFNGIDYSVNVLYRFSNGVSQQYIKDKISIILEAFVDRCLEFETDYLEFTCNNSYHSTNGKWIEN